MIDLGNFEGPKEVKLFNDGTAGEVIASLKFVKKTADRPANYPDWEMILIDEKGRELSKGFYYLSETEEGYAKKLNFQASNLKHIYHTIYGPTAPDPKAETAKQLLELVLTGCAQGVVNRVFKFVVTYGTKARPNKKGFLGVKTFIPFMTADLDTHIPVGVNDLMERIVPDEEAQYSSYADFSAPTRPEVDKLPWESKSGEVEVEKMPWDE